MAWMLIFGTKERQARRVLSALRGAARGMGSLPGVDRCAVLIVANAMLETASREFGEDVGGPPGRMPRRRAAAIVVRLADAHNRLTGMVSSLEGDAEAGLARIAVLRQLRATEATMLLVGASLDPRIRSVAAACWKSLWSARRHVADAVASLRESERAFGMEAVPRIDPARPVASDEMRALASRLPRAFHRRTSARRHGISLSSRIYAAARARIKAPGKSRTLAGGSRPTARS